MIDLWIKSSTRGDTARDYASFLAKGQDYDRVVVVEQSLNDGVEWPRLGLRGLCVAEPRVILESRFLDKLTARDLLILDALPENVLKNPQLLRRLAVCEAAIWIVGDFVPAVLPVELTMEIYNGKPDFTVA